LRSYLSVISNRAKWILVFILFSAKMHISQMFSIWNT
jgi:hypothetical protein